MEKNTFMREALKEAETAAGQGEIPVGAVIVKDGAVVARGHNMTVTGRDPTAHAEMNAIRQAAEALGSTRLTGCDMYVTLEPCAMCAGALVLGRISRLYIGAADPKSGACGSVLDVTGEAALNHQVETETGILEEECGRVLKEFFGTLRNNGKSSRDIRAKKRLSELSEEKE